MRKIVIAVMGTLSALVLVVSFDASRRGGDVATAADGNGGSDAGSADGGDTGASPDDGPSPTGATTSAGKAGPAQGSSGTFLGDEAQTRWGIVQVKITVKNGKITKAKAVQFPNENHKDDEINSWAIPELNKLAVKNQGHVDSLSGASVTSEGYRESLQSAVDKAHL